MRAALSSRSMRVVWAQSQRVTRPGATVFQPEPWQMGQIGGDAGVLIEFGAKSPKSECSRYTRNAQEGIFTAVQRGRRAGLPHAHPRDFHRAICEISRKAASGAVFQRFSL